MDNLPLKIFNNGFAVYWLEFSGLELTGGEPQTIVNFILQFLELGGLICIKTYQRCHYSTDRNTANFFII